MYKSLRCIFGVLFSISLAHAEVMVHPVGDPSSFPKSNKENKGFETVVIPKKVHKGVEWRDHLFSDTHLDQYTKALDDVEKDVLLLKLGHDPLVQLQKRYPDIPASVLSEAKKRVGSHP